MEKVKKKTGPKGKFWQKYLLVLISLVSVLHVAGTQAAEEIILGAATSLTFLEGRESFNAVKLAVDEINARGGVRIGGKRLQIRILPRVLESVQLHIGRRRRPPVLRVSRSEGVRLPAYASSRAE